MATDKQHTTLNVPTLRFPEFSGEWKECYIYQYGEIVTGNTPPTKDTENYQDGQYLWASPADLGNTKYVTETKTMLSAIGFSKTRKLPKEAILVTCIGSTIGKMGKTSCIMSTNQQINALITNEVTDSDFAYYALQSRFPLYINAIAVQAVPILSKSAFGNLKNFTASISEQSKIGKFLAIVDERIATQRKVIEKLQSLIGGITVRLTSGGVANIALCDCVECNSSILQESQLSDVGSYPVYGATGIVGYTNTVGIDGDGILIIKDGSGVGTVRYVDKPFSFTGTLNCLKAKVGYNIQYIYYCLLAFNFTPYKTGLAIPHIYFKEYGKAKFYCPSIEEQNRIVSILSSVERKIELEKSILNQLLSEKSYLLSAMFI
jgi:type I restriction enzyme S subunit